MRENKTKNLTVLLLFISPLLALFSAIRDLQWRNKKLIIILFFTIYGSLITYNDGSDAESYIRLLDLYSNMSISDFFLWLKHIITFDPLPGSPSDVYVHCLAFFTVSMFGIKGLFFPLVGTIYGYFYALALSKVLVWNNKHKITLAVLFIIILFIIHRSVTSFQTVRTWTGMWVLFNGVFGYHQTKDRKYFYLMLCSPLVHFAYFVIAVPAFIALFVKKIPTKAIIILYTVSFFTGFDPSGVLESAKENSLAEEKVGAYYRESAAGEAIDPILQNREDTTAVWYLKYGKTESVYYGGHAFAILLILGGFFKGKMTPLEIGIFATGLFMATLANFGSFSYAFYSRTMANAVLYILAAITLMAIRGAFQPKNVRNPIMIQFLQWICIFIFVPKIVFFIAEFLIMTSVFMLGFPVLGWIDNDLNVSIRDIIGELF